MRTEHDDAATWRATDTGRTGADAVRSSLGADLLAAAGKVNRYHARRLDEYRQLRWTAPAEPAAGQNASGAPAASSAAGAPGEGALGERRRPAADGRPEF